MLLVFAGVVVTMLKRETSKNNKETKKRENMTVVKADKAV
jgi:hypothetical protein